MNRIGYENDFVAWAVEQATLLRAGDIGALDLENLAEEIESMGASQRHELYSRLEVLVRHLLKWRYQPDRRSRSWRSTIWTQRGEIERRLEDSPSLRRLVPDYVARCYKTARQKAMDETGLLELPKECPFVSAQVMESDWFPD